MKRIFALTVGLLMAALTAGVSAREVVDPNIGKDAPELDVKGFVGESIAQDDLDGSPYVLEFWATWCPPCKQTIPHLNRLAKRIEPFGVPIVGISQEPMDTIKPFAEKIGMEYYVAADDGTSGGLEFKGIPFAAVVDAQGKVAWAGHPMSPKLENTLFDLVAKAHPKLAEPIGLVREGQYGKAYEKLGDIDTPMAKRARKAIAANAQEALAEATEKEGIEKVALLDSVRTAYEGLPEAAKAKTHQEKALEDGDLANEWNAMLVLKPLGEDLQEMERKAGEIAKEQGQKAAVKYYLENAATRLETFVENHPDHPQADKLRQSVKQFRGKLEEME